MPAAQLVTPKRRSARKLAPPQPTGAMLAGTGFAYAPNAALAGRLASAADGRKLALGDAMDADMLASMDEVPTRKLSLFTSAATHALPTAHLRTYCPTPQCLRRSDNIRAWLR